MIALILLGPAIVCAGIAWLARARLRELGWMAWMGVTLLGVGVPVLVGQSVAWMILSTAVDGIVTPELASEVQLWLAAGLAGGLGFGAGAVSARLTAPET